MRDDEDQVRQLGQWRGEPALACSPKPSAAFSAAFASDVCCPQKEQNLAPATCRSQTSYNSYIKCHRKT